MLYVEMPNRIEIVFHLNEFCSFPEIQFFFSSMFIFSKVFLTWRAIYIVTFDLSKNLDEKVGKIAGETLKVNANLTIVYDISVCGQIS